MPQRRPNPYGRRTRQFVGRPRYHHSYKPAGETASSFLARAYQNARRPVICTSCICLTSYERARQKRVFALTRAWHKALLKDLGA